MKLISSLLLSALLTSQSAVIRGEKGTSNDDIVYTILYNNIAAADSIIADHGFSCLIETGDHSVLFDAGRNSDTFMKNVRKLGVDCPRISRVFISHVHGDHMGGLFDILPKCNQPTLHFPFSYPQMEGELLGEEADDDFRAMLELFRPFVSGIVQGEEPAAVGNGIYTTGVIEERTYEHSLIVPTSKGLIVITGCAHPGILEIVERAKELMRRDVYFVMGGFHLFPVDSARVRTIAQELRKSAKYVGPCHCTGETARSILKDVFREDYVDIRAGMKLKLGDGGLK